MSHLTELVAFSIFDDDAPDFLVANAAINDWLRHQPGFVSRQLVRKDDGGWVDMIAWTDESCALAAAASMPSELGPRGAMRAISPVSIGMPHAAIGLSSASGLVLPAQQCTYGSTSQQDLPSP